MLFAFLNDLVTNELSNLNEIHRSGSSLTEYHTVVTTPEDSLIDRQRVASGNSYCCALITRHPVGAESMADSVSEVS